jgi:hypothetical protein
MKDYLTIAPKLLLQSTHLPFKLGHKVITHKDAAKCEDRESGTECFQVLVTTFIDI